MGAPRVTQRLEFKSFERFIQMNYTDTHTRRSQQVRGDEVAAGHIAELIGVNVQQVWQYRRRGVSIQQADRISIKLNIHPSLIWPEWWGEEADPTT